MTVVVGYLAGKGGRSALHLAVEAAKTLKTSLVVVTVVPQPWTTPSPARIDAEYAAWADKLGADSQTRGPAVSRTRSDKVSTSASTRSPAARAGEGLLEATEEIGAEVLVVGSSSNGALGQVVLGSTTDWLLHSSPVPVAISPRGYRARSRQADAPHVCVLRHAGIGPRRRTGGSAGGTARRADAGGHLRHPGSHHVPTGSRPARRGFVARGVGAAVARDARETEGGRRRRRRRCPGSDHRKRLGRSAGRRPNGRTAICWRWAPRRGAASRRCSWGRTARRSSGTARCRCWCCRASTSRCRGRRRSDCPRSSPTRHRPARQPRRKPLRAVMNSIRPFLP